MALTAPCMGACIWMWGSGLGLQLETCVAAPHRWPSMPCASHTATQPSSPPGLRQHSSGFVGQEVCGRLCGCTSNAEKLQSPCLTSSHIRKRTTRPKQGTAGLPLVFSRCIESSQELGQACRPFRDKSGPAVVVTGMVGALAEGNLGIVPSWWGPESSVGSRAWRVCGREAAHPYPWLFL